jgi:hypothetical protein
MVGFTPCPLFPGVIAPPEPTEQEEGGPHNWCGRFEKNLLTLPGIERFPGRPVLSAQSLYGSYYASVVVHKIRISSNRLIQHYNLRECKRFQIIQTSTNTQVSCTVQYPTLLQHEVKKNQLFCLLKYSVLRNDFVLEKTTTGMQGKFTAMTPNLPRHRCTCTNGSLPVQMKLFFFSSGYTE